jgi:CBS domain-containing protein
LAIIKRAVELAILDLGSPPRFAWLSIGSQGVRTLLYTDQDSILVFEDVVCR